MDSNYNKFSIKRIGWLLRYYAVTERSSYIIYTLISIIALQVPYLFAAYCCYEKRPYTMEHHIMYNIELSIGVGGTMVTLLLLIIAASTLMGSTATKEERSNHIMIPSKNSEKFAAQLLICTIGAYMVILVAHLLGMLSYCLLLALMGAPAKFFSYATLLFESAWYVITDINQSLLAITGLALLLYSICFLGATHWRRQRFLKNICIVILSAPMPFLLVMLLCDLSFNENTAEVISIIVFYVLSVLFMWLAWRKYCRIQNIEREGKLWKPTVALLAVYVILFLLYTQGGGRRVIVIDEARLERITGADFPHYSHFSEKDYNDGGILGDFTTVSTYKFDEHPSEEFYRQLDSLSQKQRVLSYGWQKGTILRDKKNPQLGEITEYLYHNSWGNGSQAPEGEDSEADRYIQVRITKGVKGFQITYGAH